MATFRDIWNLVITGDTSDVKGKLSGLGRTTEETGQTIDNTFRGRVNRALQGFGISSEQAGALMKTAMIGGAALAGDAIVKFAGKAIDEFQKQSQAVLHFKQVTGLAADEASRFVAVADDYAVSAEDLSSAVGKLDKTAGTTPQNLEKLGVAIGHNQAGAYDAQKTFLNVVDAYNATSDSSKQAAIAQAAFGKQWQGLVNLLDQGSGKLRESFASVAEQQLFSDADLKKSEQYRHAIDDLQDAVKGLERELGQTLIPAVAAVAHGLTDFVQGVEEAGDQLGKIGAPIRWLFDRIGDLTEAMDDNKDSSSALTDEWKKQGVFTRQLAEQTHDLAVAQADLTTAQHESALATLAHRREAEKALEVAQLYQERTEGVTKALSAQREAAEKATQAIKDNRQATEDAMNAQLGLEGAIYSALDAIDAATAKMRDATATTREQAEANLDAEKSFHAVAAQALETATAQATAHGATLTFNQGVAAQVAALQGLEAEMDPDGPLFAKIQLYILTILSIPGAVVTNVDITGNGLAVQPATPGGITRREGSGGGTVPSSVNGAATATALRTYQRGLQ